MKPPFEAYRGDQPYVFACYSHADSAVVYPELVALRDAGVHVWYDEGIPAGTQWREELAQRIRGARQLVLFVSPRSMGSEHCRREVDFALEVDVPVIALHLEQTELPDGMRMALGQRQAILKHVRGAASARRQLLEALGSRPAVVAPDSTPSRRAPMSRWQHAVGLFALVALLGSAVWLFLQAPTEDPQAWGLTESNGAALEATTTVAVLPFEAPDDEPGLQAFAEVLRADIVDRLTGNRGMDPLRVVDRAADSYHQLRASLRASGSSATASVQLLRTRDGETVWSDSFEIARDAGARDLASPAGEIAYNTLVWRGYDISPLFWKLFSADGRPARPGAVAMALRGEREYLLMNSGRGGNFALATDYYEQALQISPDFYWPHFILVGYYRDRAGVDLALDEAHMRARTLIRRAFEILPRTSNSFMLYQLGTVLFKLELDYVGAEAAFDEALGLDPGQMFIRYFKALAVAAHGRPAEARQLLRAEMQIDHGAEQSGFLGGAGLQLEALGHDHEALDAWNAALALSHVAVGRAPHLRHAAIGRATTGDLEGAAQLIDEAWAIDGDRRPHTFIWPLAASGQHQRARALADRWLAREPRPTEEGTSATYHGYRMVRAFLALGEHDIALDLLDDALARHDPFVIATVRHGRWSQPLHGAPGFDAILGRLADMEKRLRGAYSGVQPVPVRP